MYLITAATLFTLQGGEHSRHSVATRDQRTYDHRGEVAIGR